MKIVHIESGLGNQMLSYCEYLALKMMNPNDNIFIETIVYDIPECNETIKQWNGYELNMIFGITAPNLKDYISKDKWDQIMNEIRASHFWDRNWNYPVWFTKAFNKAGLNVINIRGDFEQSGYGYNINMKKPEHRTVRKALVNTYIGNCLKTVYRQLNSKKQLRKTYQANKIFLKTEDNIFTGQFLAFKNKGNKIEIIEDLIRKTFIFPVFQDSQNIRMAELLQSVNSVFIHARRGDMLGCNGYCYKFGYFKKAVKYIKLHVKAPVFVFFCDPGSIEWCKQNANIFSIDFNRDEVYFVDWNKGNQSFRDMQLMSYCKHGVITNSSFGWWGTYLIQNKDKITISPAQEIAIDTTVKC